MNKNVLLELLEQPAKINLEKTKDGCFNCNIKGKKFSILFLLALAEMNILEQIKCSNEEFEFIKIIAKVGVKKDEKN